MYKHNDLKRNGKIPKLKVGLVLDDTLDTPDGVQQYVLGLGKWLSKNGNDVHYLVGHTTRKDIDNIHSLSRNLKVRFNQNRLSLPLPVSSRKLSQFLAEQKFDILHVQMPYSPMLGAKIVNSAPAETSVVGTFHVAPYNKLVVAANKTLGAVLKKSLKRFDEVICVSESASKLAGGAFGIKGRIIPNSVDLQNFFNAKPFEELKGRNIVFVGRLVKRKGCKYLLKALNRIKNDNMMPLDDLHVHICGAGPLEADLQKYVLRNGLAKIVQFEGFISEESKPRYLASSDIAVYPSTGGESFGIVLLEGMAASRGAVIAGNNSGYSEVLKNHPEALFNPKNTNEFAKLIVKALSDGKYLDRAQTWQRKEAEKYDIEEVGPQILSVYTMALRKRER